MKKWGLWIIALATAAAVVYLAAIRPAGAALDPAAPVEDTEPPLLSLELVETLQFLIRIQRIYNEEHWRVYEEIWEQFEQMRRRLEFNEGGE